MSYGRHETDGYPTKYVLLSKISSILSGADITQDRYGNTKYLVGDTGDNNFMSLSKFPYDFLENFDVALLQNLSPFQCQKKNYKKACVFFCFMIVIYYYASEKKHNFK